MSTTTAQPAIGFIGLGDQGLPMATAIAEAGYSLHVWARQPGSLDALGNVAHVCHDDSKDLAASCDIVALCVSTDEDVMQIVTTYRPSYRCLAWYLTQNGYHVGADLLGDDQPEAVARQYEAEATWLAWISSRGPATRFLAAPSREERPSTLSGRSVSAAVYADAVREEGTEEIAPEDRYADLVDELVGIPGVTPPRGGGGFGRTALRFQNKIFAMLVRGRLVLKLPAERVDALIAGGDGVRFDANKSTPMREWFSLDPQSGRAWLPLACEALEFARAGR